MPWAIFVIPLGLRRLGPASPHTLGGPHILLAVALLIVLIGVIQGQRPS